MARLHVAAGRQTFAVSAARRTVSSGSTVSACARSRSMTTASGSAMSASASSTMSSGGCRARALRPARRRAIRRTTAAARRAGWRVGLGADGGLKSEAAISAATSAEQAPHRTSVAAARSIRQSCRSPVRWRSSGHSRSVRLQADVAGRLKPAATALGKRLVRRRRRRLAPRPLHQQHERHHAQ